MTIVRCLESGMKRGLLALACAATACVVSGVTLAAEPFLVKDICTGAQGSFPGGDGGAGRAVAIGTELYFAAFDPTHGRALWKTDGTPGGTVLVKDVDPAPADCLPTTGNVDWIVEMGGMLYFSAGDAVNGRELWKSDGTEAGTVMVKDIRPGGSSIPQFLVVLGSNLYFTADDGVAGVEIWKSDGTAAGTQRVTDLVPGLASKEPAWLAPVGDHIYFFARSETLFELTFELWKTDGTAAGTTMVRGGFVGVGRNIVDVGGVAFFSATGTVSEGEELWKSDGTTAGTVLVKDIAFGNSYPQGIVSFKGQAFFAAAGEIWKSDGTAEGTQILKDINPGPSDAVTPLLNAFAFVAVNNKLFFGAYDGVNAGLWRTDGTADGTEFVKAFFSPTIFPQAIPLPLAQIGGTLYFSADDAAAGRELWALPDAAPADTTPDAFSFVDQPDVHRGLTVMSAPVTIGGIDAPAPISVTAGEYAIGCGNAFTSAAGTIANGQSVCVRHVSAGAAGGTVDTVLTVGGVSDTFTSTATADPRRAQVASYYRTVLRREPDAGGLAFWESEAGRMQALGANVNETWYALGMTFFFSAEYAAFGRNPTEFVRDLYMTFFGRVADSEGLAFWTSQMASGMPREVVLVSFLLSPEFTSFTRSIFGEPTTRAEIDMVTDFYRGLLARLPDSAGFDHWVRLFREAQCAGAGLVSLRAGSISAGFLDSPEYAGRARTNAQYVGDLYNAFLRRGGDLDGVKFWIQRLESGFTSRQVVRQAFVNSPEFANRVAAVVAQGCVP